MKPEPLPCLFGHGGKGRIEELTEFREVITDLPETKSTFYPAAYLDRSTVLTFQNNPRLLQFTGSWPLPPWLIGGSESHLPRLVNPEYAHAKRFSMAGVECECGNIITRRGGNTGLENEHGTGCTPDDRRRVRRRLTDIRITRIVTGAHLNQDQKTIGQSIGLTPNYMTTFIKDVGLNWDTLRDIGRMRMGASIDILSEQGYSQREIATAFDISRKSVYDYARNRYVSKDLRDKATA